MYGNDETVRSILARTPPSVHDVISPWHIILLSAMKHQSPEIVSMVLDPVRGPWITNEGKKILQTAADVQNPDVLSLLLTHLESKETPNTFESCVTHLLHVSYTDGRTETLRYLLSRESEISGDLLFNKRINLSDAWKGGHAETLELLLTAGIADIEELNSKGWS
ncbi:hypothetical protein BJX76DRAFT_354712 [Aspergillus varians]